MRCPGRGARRNAFTGADPRLDGRTDVDRRARDAGGTDAESHIRTGPDTAAAGIRAAATTASTQSPLW